MNRQEGYYWIKHPNNDKHELAYWEYAIDVWFLICDKKAYQDSDFEHINENRIKQPGELPD